MVDRIVGLTNVSLADKNWWEMVLRPSGLPTTNKMCDRNSQARREEGTSALFRWLLNRTVIQDRNRVMKRRATEKDQKREVG